MAQDVEALRIGLHEPVLDPVVDHLREVASAHRPAMHIAALGARIAAFATGRRRNIAWPRRQRIEDRIEMSDGRLLAADHHAIAFLQPPDAAARPDIDVADAPAGEHLRPAYVVLVEAVAAIDDDVVRLHRLRELAHGVLGHLARGQHHPDRARLVELAHEVLQIAGR